MILWVVVPRGPSWRALLIAFVVLAGAAFGIERCAKRFSTLRVCSRDDHDTSAPPARRGLPRVQARGAEDGVSLKRTTLTTHRCDACGTRYTMDEWLALPCVGVIRGPDEDDDGEVDRRTIELRSCPRCRHVLAARVPFLAS